MYLSLILVLPLAGAAAVGLIPRRMAALHRLCAAVIAGLTVALAVPLWFRYNAQSAEFQFVERVRLWPAAGIEYFLGVDGYGVLLIILIALVGAAVVASAAAPGDRAKARLVAWLVTEAGLFGAVMALDFAIVFVCWLAMLAGLVAGAATAARRVSAAAVVYSLASVLALAGGIAAIYLANHESTGVYTFDVTAFHKLTLTSGMASAVFFSLLIAWVAAVPLFLRSGASGPVVAVAVLPLYGFYRFAVPMVPDAFARFGPVVAAACCAAAIVAAALAWRERTVARIVRSWIIAQTAFVLFAIVALNEAAMTGGMIQQLGQGLAVAACALIAGVSPALPAPVRRAFWIVGAWALLGLPGSLSFVGTRMIGGGAGGVRPVLAALSAAALLAVAARLVVVHWRADEADGPAATPRVPALAGAALSALLLALVIGGGLFPGAVQERLKIAAHHVASHVTPTDGTAAECDTVPTPEQLSASPGSQFLLAVPCGPDGQPLSPPSAPK